MKRNLKFWTRYTWECVWVDFVIAAVLAFVALFGMEGLDGRLFASVTPYFLCAAAILGMMMINMGSQTLYVPLLLSMGETRRNVLLGFHYYRALIIAVTAGLCALVWLLVPGEASATGLGSLPSILCALVTASALGSIMGTVFVKWKWLGTIIIILLCGGMGGVIGGSGAAMAQGALDPASLTKMMSFLAGQSWWPPAAAAALAADVAFQWLLLRRQEVKL